MKKFMLIPFVIYGYAIVAWVVNLVKLLNCDFEGPSWKAEVIHAIGLIPGVSMITCWF
jgi:hypothetical protein